MGKIRKQLLPSLWPPLVSIAAAVVLWKFKVSDDPVALACFALLLDLFFVIHQTRYRIDDARVALGRLLGLLGDLPKYPRVATALSSIYGVASSGNRFSRACLAHLVEDLEARARRLHSGTQYYGAGAFMDVAPSLLRKLNAGDTLKAISISAGGEYWRQQYSAAYKQLNKDAWERGAKIERIYSFRDDQQFEENKDLLREMSHYSIVYSVVWSKVHRPHGLSQGRDMFVINDELATDWIFSHTDFELQGVNVITDAGTVADRNKDFDRLKHDVAEKYVP